MVYQPQNKAQFWTESASASQCPIQGTLPQLIIMIKSFVNLSIYENKCQSGDRKRKNLPLVLFGKITQKNHHSLSAQNSQIILLLPLEIHLAAVSHFSGEIQQSHCPELAQENFPFGITPSQHRRVENSSPTQ